jgi:lipoprotein-anchoring transpeptidase ErfK/SrfK
MDNLPVRRLCRVPIALGLALALLPGAALAQGSVTVSPGDTLGAIAQRSGTTVAALVQANSLPSADLVYVGQRLLLPDGAAAPLLAALPAAAAAPSAASSGVHVVQPGETVYHLAATYGVPVASIVAANGLTSANVIYAGQRLEIPLVPSGIGRADPATAPTKTLRPDLAANDRTVLVTLSSQRLTAYEGGRPVATFAISSGREWTPTPVGHFRIYSRYRSQTMTGPGYYLPGVPYVQYFTGNYALHGAYWHNDFGTRTSHGCVNLAIPDAAWLWNWASMGTEVVVEN